MAHRQIDHCRPFKTKDAALPAADKIIVDHLKPEDAALPAADKIIVDHFKMKMLLCQLQTNRSIDLGGPQTSRSLKTTSVVHRQVDHLKTTDTMTSVVHRRIDH